MSLSESLMTIFILILIIFLLLGVYVSMTRIFDMQIAYNEISSLSTIAIHKINENIRGALTIVDSATINSVNYSTDHNTLIVELPSIDTNQNIIPNTYDYLVYYRDSSDNTLLKSDLQPGAGSTRQSGVRLVSQFVDNIIFNYNDIDYATANKVETILITRRTIRGQNQEIVMQTSTTLRNK